VVPSFSNTLEKTSVHHVRQSAFSAAMGGMPEMQYLHLTGSCKPCWQGDTCKIASCPHCHNNSHVIWRKIKKNRRATLKCRERRIAGESVAHARLAEEVPRTTSERVVEMDLQLGVQQHQSSAASPAAFPAAFPAASQQPLDRQQLRLHDAVMCLPGRVARRWADYSSEEGSEAERVASTMRRLPGRVARRWADYSSEEESEAVEDAESEAEYDAHL